MNDQNDDNSFGYNEISDNDPRRKYLKEGYFLNSPEEAAQKSKIKKRFTGLRIVVLIFSAFILLYFIISFISCTSKPKSPYKVEKELEKKYGFDFEYVDERSIDRGLKREDGDMYYIDSKITKYYYKDEFGNKWVVTFSKGKYTDDLYYVEDYSNIYGYKIIDEYIEMLRNSGLEIIRKGEERKLGAYFCKFSNYEELDNILVKVDEANKWLNEEYDRLESSYIKSEIGLYYYLEPVYYYYTGEGFSGSKVVTNYIDLVKSVRTIGNSNFDSDDIRKKYAEWVSEGKVSDNIK